jgi:hypothetical protein
MNPRFSSIYKYLLHRWARLMRHEVGYIEAKGLGRAGSTETKRDKVALGSTAIYILYMSDVLYVRSCTYSFSESQKSAKLKSINITVSFAPRFVGENFESPSQSNALTTRFAKTI